jgi:hypothetical protein
MHQLIGIALVVALMLAVMPAPGGAAADDANSLFPVAQRSEHLTILSVAPPVSSPTAAVAVPNFLSYRDRARLADATNPSARNQPSRPANTAEPADDDDPTGFLVPHAVGGAYEY